MLIPGPDHPITITPTEGEVTVRIADTVIASTRHALGMAEADYPVVQYVPLGDVNREHLRPSATVTTCPYKGDASYYTVRLGEQSYPDAVWQYPTPHDAVAEIADFVAFDPRVAEVTVAG